MTEKKKWSIGISLVFLTKLIFLFETGFKESSYKTPDSNEYLTLAKSFFSSYLSNTKNGDLSVLRTPGYPFFINLISTRNLWIVIFVQIVLSLFIAIGMSKIIAKTRSTNHSFPLFIICSIETSLLSESYALLTEILFTSLIVLGFYSLLKGIENSNPRIAMILLSGLSFGIAILVRPVGIFLITLLGITFIFHYINRKHALMILVSIVSISGLWTLRNEIVYQVPSVSSIESNNLLYWEGAGAVAISKRLNIDEVQKEETIRRDQVIGVSAPISQRFKYERSRGLHLISTNIAGFLEMHVIGIIKIVIGPGQGEFINALSKGERQRASGLIEIVLILLMALITLSILALFILGFFRNRLIGVEKMMMCYVVLMLIGSSGYQAYSRFRAPIAPFICYFSAVGLLRLRTFLTKRSLVE